MAPPSLPDVDHPHQQDHRDRYQRDRFSFEAFHLSSSLRFFRMNAAAAATTARATGAAT